MPHSALQLPQLESVAVVEVAVVEVAVEVEVPQHALVVELALDEASMEAVASSCLALTWVAVVELPAPEAVMAQPW